MYIELKKNLLKKFYLLINIDMSFKTKYSRDQNI